MAIPSKLYRLGAPKIFSRVWQIDAISWMKEILQSTEDQVVDVEIKEIYKGVLGVDIIGENELSLTDIMIKKHFAVEVEESQDFVVRNRKNIHMHKIFTSFYYIFVSG